MPRSHRHFGLYLLCPVLLFSTVARAQLFSQQGSKLVGSGAINQPNSSQATGFDGVNQGTSVALSSDGNTALVGGPNDNAGIGAAWVFVRINGIWSQQGSKLTASDETGDGNFGQSVSLSGDGNTALVGGPGDNNGAGAAWVFTRASGGTWSQQGNKLVGSGSVPAQSGQGGAVSLSADGNTALVGATGNKGTSEVGAAWIFTRASSGAWTQQSELSLLSPPISSVALSGDGNTAALGSSSAGKVWIFIRGSNGAWGQQGSPLSGGASTGLGASVALSNDGNTLLGGASGDMGGAYVFTRDASGNWSQQSMLANDIEISSVALSADGNTALLGNSAYDGGIGAAWVFTRDNSGNWTEQTSPLVGAGGVYTGLIGVGEGASVALSSDGSTALVGGPDDNQLVGAAWPFVRATDLFAYVPGWLSQLSVGADGAVWGINGFGQIYSYDFATASWMNIPGALTQIAVGSSTAIWGIDAQHYIYQWDSANSKWNQIPGSLVQIAVGADGDVWGLNQDSSIYHYDPQTGFFDEVTGYLAQISVGSAAAVYGLTTDGTIFWYNPGLGRFQQITTASGFNQISVGVDGVLWGVADNVAYHYDALRNSMDATPGSIAQVAVGAGVYVYGLNAYQQIYQWNSNTGSWVEIPGALESIAVGANGIVWGLNSAQQIYQFGGPTRPVSAISQVLGQTSVSPRQISVGVDGSVWGLAYNGAYQDSQVEYFNSATQSFEAVSGAPPLIEISVGAGADVWGVNTAGSIYQYDSATGNWNLIPGELNFVKVGGDGSVWGINIWGGTYNYDFSTDSWINIPGELATLSVGADGTVWGLNDAGYVYRFDLGSQSWLNVPGNLSQISVGSAANIWGVNSNGEVFRFASGSWERIPNILLGSIAATFDGSVFGLGTTYGNSNNAINMYNWNPATQSFNYVGALLGFGNEIPQPGPVTISAGNAYAAWASAIGNYGGPSIIYSWF
jgi:Tectonin domain/FG-GAP repeat